MRVKRNVLPALLGPIIIGGGIAAWALFYNIRKGIEHGDEPPAERIIKSSAVPFAIIAAAIAIIVLAGRK